MPIRGLGTDDILPPGGLLSCLCNYTLASYSAAGTRTPTAGDIVVFTTSNRRVVLAPDNDIGNTGIGRVVGDVNASDLTVQVEWLNIVAFVELDTDDAATVTLGNSCIKDGNTTVVNNFDGGAAAGNLVAVALSATTGAAKVQAAVVITGK